MNPTNQLLHRIADPALNHDERARLRCQLAKELEETGSYEAAREAMSGLWSRVGERPTLHDLEAASLTSPTTANRRVSLGDPGACPRCGHCPHPSNH
jgi:hypothetical protein